jgi:hypothetical protein
MPVALAAVPYPSLVPVFLITAGVIVVSIGLLVAIGRSDGPGPSETAVAYERAWDRLDFATLWSLSSPTLRDGRTQAQFVRDKEAAYRSEEGGLARLVQSVRPERVERKGPLARVFTRLELHDGQSVVDEMLLERNGATWQVTAYHLASRRHDWAQRDET